MNPIKVLLAISFLALSTYVYAAGNTAAVNITSIELRDSGHHAIFVDGAVPDEFCSLSDRAILLEGGGSGKAMLGTAVMAVGAEKAVQIRVDGCTEINPGQSNYTAPRVVKMQIYN